MRTPKIFSLSLFLILFIGSELMAQAEIAEVTVIKLKYGTQQSMQDVFPGKDGFNYVLMSKKGAVSTAWSKEKVVIKKIDSDLNFVEDIPLDFAKFDPNSTENGIWLIHDASFTNHAVWNEYSENSMTFFTCPIEDVTSIREIATVQIKSKKNIQSVGISSSQASESFAIDVVEEDYGVTHTQIIALDGQLKKLWIQSMDCEDDVSREGYVINDSGACLHMFQFEEEIGKEPPFATTVLFTLISPSGHKSSHTRQFYLGRISSTLVSNSDMLSAVILLKLIHGKKKKDLKVTYENFRYNFNPSTGELLDEVDDRMSSTVILELIGKSHSSLQLSHALSLPDSSIIVLGGVKSVRPGRWVTSYNRPVAGGISTSYNKTTAFYSGVIAYHIKANGEVGRIKAFVSDYSINDFWLMDISPRQIGDHIYFTYMAKGMKINLVRLGVTDDKLHSAVQLYDKDDSGGRGLVALTSSTTMNGSIIAVLNHPRKQARVVHFALKD